MQNNYESLILVVYPLDTKTAKKLHDKPRKIIRKLKTTEISNHSEDASRRF